MKQLPLLPDVLNKVTGIVVRKAQTSPVDLIARRYQDLRGSFVFDSQWGQARRLARKILDAGFTAEQVIACMEWLHEHPRHADQNWSLAFVGKMMNAWQRREDQRGVVNLVEVPENFK